MRRCSVVQFPNALSPQRQKKKEKENASVYWVCTTCCPICRRAACDPQSDADTCPIYSPADIPERDEASGAGDEKKKNASQMRKVSSSPISCCVRITFLLNAARWVFTQLSVRQPRARHIHVCLGDRKSRDNKRLVAQRPGGLYRIVELYVAPEEK